MTPELTVLALAAILLVLVAAPLRRSGAYTLPDFAELRRDWESAWRKAASKAEVPA